MKPGKISENVLKRSVLKYTNLNQEHIEKGAGIGNDCAFFTCFGKEGLRSAASQTLSLPVLEPVLMEHTIYGALNSLLAGNGIVAEKGKTDALETQIRAGILINITLPLREREIKLAQMMQRASEICETENIAILGGHTEVSSAVTRPVVTVTAICMNSAQIQKRSYDKAALNGCDIVVSKYIGMEAASLIAQMKEEELLDRFPKGMVEEIKNDSSSLSIYLEVSVAADFGVSLMHDIREGGIFGALWEMAEGAGVGLSVDLKKIPMKQMVIEICNYYDLNPYESLSAGSLLMVSADGEGLVNRLADLGIVSAVIGKITDGNDRVIVSGEEVRYLDLPKPDQIRKLEDL